MGLHVLPKKRNASEMEYKHKLQRTRGKLRLVRAEPQRAWEKQRLAQKKLRLGREEPQYSP